MTTDNKEANWTAQIADSAKKVPSFSIVVTVAFWWAKNTGISFDHFGSVLGLAAVLVASYVLTAVFDGWFDALVRPALSDDRGGLLIRLKLLPELEKQRTDVRNTLQLRQDSMGIYALSQSIVFGTREWTERIEPFRAHSRSFRALVGLILVAGVLRFLGLLPLPHSLLILQGSNAILIGCWCLVLLLAFLFFAVFRVLHMLRLYRFINKVVCISIPASDISILRLGPNLRSLDGSVQAANEELARRGRTSSIHLGDLSVKRS